MNIDRERRNALQKDFAEFLDPDHGNAEYSDQVRALLEPEIPTKLRLNVDVHDVREHNAQLYNKLLADPSECIPAFEDAVDQLARHLFPDLLKDQRIRIGFFGEFGRYRLTPRQLTAENISRLVNVEGIVIRCSIVRPKIETSVHYCDTTGQYSTKTYRDAASLEGGIITDSTYPAKDPEGNVLSTMYGLATYRNFQKITIQELPENAPSGQLPRSTEVNLEDDLIDSCKPGDRVSLVGVYKGLTPRAQGSVTGVLTAKLLVNSVRPLIAEKRSTDVTEVELKAIEQLAQEEDVIDQLAMSLAPSIYGHKTIKKGLLTQLLGEKGWSAGRERQLDNGTHLRGDINCLLVGDPGVAKSQMLRAIMNVCPLSVSTTGRGASGVGLTAAVLTDPDTGERRLEAGAMVLADRGIVCIDEFDKMSDIDRVAIHEVMEQQTVTIAKAGIQMSLNARCSVLAAANPLYGSYDHTIPIQRNINLPDPLLSRFDLLFLVLDNLSEAQDHAIAGHVLGQHRYRAVGDDGTRVNNPNSRPLEEDEEMESQEDSNAWMYCRHNTALYGALPPGVKPPLAIKFLKKYLAVAKERGREITLSDEALPVISDFYGELRADSQNAQNALTVTVRTLETIIRLSTAMAKARLADSVEPRDVEAAKMLIRDMHAGNFQGDEMEADKNEADMDVDQGPADAPQASQPPRDDSATPVRAEIRSPESGSRRTRSTGSNRSNDENDPGQTGAARALPRRRATGPPLSETAAADVAGPSESLLPDEQVDIVRDALKRVMRNRAWTGSGTPAQIVAQLLEDGVEMHESLVIRALVKLQDAYERDEKAEVPMTYDAEDNRFYEL